MVFISRAVAFFVVGLIATHASTLLCQDTQDPKEGDFSISSSISLGLGGFTTSTQFKLVDELGFEYDAMSMLRNPMVRELTGVDDAQFDEIQNQWEIATEPMIGMVLDTVLLDQNKDELKELFEQAQFEVLEQLQPEQVQQLDQARHQIGIERFGVSEYLGTKRISEQLGFTPEQTQSLAECKTAFHEKYLDLIRNELIEANTALLSELTDSQRQSVQDHLGESGHRSFLTSRLFTDAATTQKRPERHQLAIVGMTRNRSIRESCDIDADQYELIKVLKRNMRTMQQEAIASELDEILRPEQIAKLEEKAVMDQVKRLGTANTLCYGLLARHLELSPDAAEKLFAHGQQVHESFLAAAADVNSKTITASMSTLSADQRVQVIAMIGDADPLKSNR